MSERSERPDGGQVAVHATAVVHPGAVLEEGVSVGPYAVIGDGVVVGAGTVIGAHVVVESGARIGPANQIFPGAVIGGPPQDRAYKGEPTGVVIGQGNIIREHVTIHRASGEGNRTVVGDHCFFMCGVHVAHNCRIGSHVTLVNFTGLAGHVQVDDHAFLGGGTMVHQYTRIGRLAICGAHTKTVQDIPPYALVDGNPARVCGLNRIGIQRLGISLDSRRALKQAYKLLYLSGLNTTQAIARIEDELGTDPEVRHLLNFLAEGQARHRGLTQWEKTRTASEEDLS